MRKYKVGVTDHLFSDLNIEQEILEQADAEVLDLKLTSGLEFTQAALNCDGFINAWLKFDQSVIAKLFKCKIIARYGIGVDNVDLAEATKKGIYVTNVPDYGNEEVAVHTLSLLLALSRRLFKYSGDVRAGKWDYHVSPPIHRLSEQVVGLVGFGRIAQAVAVRASAFGMQILAYDPFLDVKNVIPNNNVKQVNSLEEMLPKCDYLSLHLPLNSETKYLLNEARFSLMKESCFLINTSRGAVVDEDALYLALQEGRLAGAALDVLEMEPPSLSHPLFSLENVIVTPHAASYSEEAMLNMRRFAAEQVVMVLKGSVPTNLINKEVLEKG